MKSERIDQTFRDAIANYCNQRRGAQRALAALSGVCQPAISDFLAGKSDMKWTNVAKLIAALGLGIGRTKKRKKAVAA